ncbi:hypothetical protein EHM92_03740 [bacterium]|nr:MAG: hypothetical protein EHM92_03740 [bacterium]
MKTLSVIGFVLILLVAGCQQPNAVEVIPDLEESQLEVTSLAMVDTTVYSTGIDSLAVIPSDQERFAGLLLVNNVKFDGGARWGSQTAAFSSVCVTDRSRPLELRGKVFGYYGIRLMPNLLSPVRINGLPMREKAHRVRIAGIPISFGYEYDADISSIYQPDVAFTWTATPDSLGPVQVSIQSPANLTVASPVGGSIIRRNRDLRLEWTGQGEMLIILSAYNPVGKQSRPILKMRPLANRGHARVNAAILQALPGDRYYVFTFIVANRKEVRINRNAESVLVLAQAASVHNVYVEFQ